MLKRLLILLAAAAILSFADAAPQPVQMDLPQQTDLAVSLYIPGNPSATVSHLAAHTGARQTTYVSANGDFTASPAIESPVTSTS